MYIYLRELHRWSESRRNVNSQNSAYTTLPTSLTQHYKSQVHKKEQSRFSVVITLGLGLRFVFMIHFFFWGESGKWRPAATLRSEG